MYETLFRANFVDKKGIARQYSGVTLKDVAKILAHASLQKPFNVSEIRDGKAA
jgi:hypothetical protein